MNEIKNVMWMYALSPVHSGNGDDLNYIDMPIQRERHTKFPKFEASGIKGAVRHAMEDGKDDQVENEANSLLGKAGNGEGDSHAGAVVFSDARLLFFPVKSAKGIFAWVTCPMAAQRFLQDCKMMEIPTKLKKGGLSLESNQALVAKESDCALCFEIGKTKKIMLEEFVFDCVGKESFAEFLKMLKESLPEDSFLKERILSHVAMISDDDFEYFVTQSTEVVTRIRIESESRTAKGQALFTEEYLPPESLLYSMLIFTEPKQAQGEIKEPNNVKEVFDRYLPSDSILQIGGDMTLGKGLVKIKRCDRF